MPINFGENTLESFAALKPQKNVFIAKPTKIQDSYRLYFPKDFSEAFGIQKGDKVFVSYCETEDLLYLDPPEGQDNIPFLKEARVQSANYSTKYIILPKKMMSRYSEQVTKITIAQLDTSRVFKLLFI